MQDRAEDGAARRGDQVAHPYEVGAVDAARVADHDHALDPVDEREGVGVGEDGGGEDDDGRPGFVGLGEESGGRGGGERAGHVAHAAAGHEVEGAGLARVHGQLVSGGPASAALPEPG